MNPNAIITENPFIRCECGRDARLSEMVLHEGKYRCPACTHAHINTSKCFYCSGPCCSVCNYCDKCGPPSDMLQIEMEMEEFERKRRRSRRAS